MAKEVSITMRLAEGMHFVGENEAGLAVDLDSPTEGAGAGPSPMALVLMSLAGCAGMDVIGIMRKKRQDVRGLTVAARGARSEEYPKPYTAIRLEFRFAGPGIEPTACERAIELTRDRYCPVWAMLSPSVDITYSYTIAE
ncbi:MAG TPA: OsmC family protein [Chloroflexaceae bacterium]|nr:OsmC family protein [Chloroflexaceae bacterium]